MANRTASAPASSDQFIPKMPTSIKETGLGLGFLTDLAIKIMYTEGNISGYGLAERMKLPYPGVIDQVLEFLRHEKLCEVKGSGGFAEAAYQYAIAEKGRLTAREALDRSQYAGPAPVTLAAYIQAIHRQPLGGIVANQRSIRKALSHLVMSEETFAQLGPAVNSGRSVFLFGSPGNGKTAIAESIGRMMMGNDMHIPHAIEVGGQIIRVFDGVNHTEIDGSSSDTRDQDPRWVHIRRPVIITGGELTLETLDLVYDETNKYY
jgi:predicted ATPase with chaperone activity